MPLCYCRECLSEDIRDFGYAYWHRKHQLPSVLVCSTHAIALNYAHIRQDGRGRSGLFLPDDSEIQHYQSVPELGRGAPLLNKLAILSKMALEIDLLAQYSATSLKATYLHGLKQQGLLNASGSVRARDFISRLTKHYETISQFSPFNRIIGKDYIEGLLRLLRKPRGYFHTASHLIMIDFLFGDWKLFNTVYLWEQQLDLPFNNNNNFELTSPNYPNMDSYLGLRLIELANRFKKHEGSLSKIARELNININTAMRWIGKMGLIEIPRKPKIMTNSIKNNVILLLSDGLPLKEIVSKTGLSKSTIDRVCNEQPELHQIWQSAKKELKRKKGREDYLRYINNNPETTQSELRKDSSSGYRWLHQNDFSWLSKNLPQKQPVKRFQKISVKARVNWGKRDNECLAALKKCNPINLESWERIKAKAILRRLPKLSFSPRLERLPKSREWVTNQLSQLTKRRSCNG